MATMLSHYLNFLSICAQHSEFLSPPSLPDTILSLFFQSLCGFAPAFHVGSISKVTNQNILDIMTLSSISVFDSDQLKIVLSADLVFLSISFLNDIVFIMLLPV